MTRTFIALELNETLQRHLAGVIRQMAAVFPSIHWVDPSGIHLTLAFLGELSDKQLQAAMTATETAAQQVDPFSYQLSHLGIFGSIRAPRVIWMGIEEPPGRLQALHQALQAQLAQQQFPVEERPFSPHLTLARIKNPFTTEEQQHLQRFLAGKLGGPEAHTPFTVSALNVMKSELSRDGAHYTVLRSYPLRGGA